ncbi:sensor histidine kinase [Lactonifactor longoviformis]|uniref:histidine kinase n=1 Tax=Lactonifactor longoviformis DSM 17459 TaxID=1122155 RepID=A0A1M4VD69_9CLOT|nr:sensor histidine kinase [Lactonifactor longoviformis]POP31176.1 sensor histidine kinase [Lactonifactor longoviformis]SHE66847.1 Signal transduction histidine kinase [Lactonifactor longoviformis DSM 17459]
MKFSDYMKDNQITLLVCFAGGLFFSVLLLAFGISLSEMALLWVCFAIIVFFTMFAYFRKQQKRIQYLLETMETLDKKYLIAEIADRPETELEKIYFRLLKTALKSMTDEVTEIRRLNMEYKDFIEQWIHEIKVPITGVQLLCENNKTEIMRKIIAQTELMEQSIEKVLFYARLGSVEKDYLIKEISLKQCVLEVLSRNKQFLIHNRVCVHTDSISDLVYSDSKWLGFIINQIIFNSIKYCSDKPPVIHLKSKDMGDYVTLSITDNGIGIKQSEVNRVFDKGFVGSNGRMRKKSTGIGLYLCDQLCLKLGIGIDIESEIGCYTTVLLHFPKSNHLNV